jgi:non-specific serine/threonine protein kinase
VEGPETRTFGTLLRRYRTDRGLTQEELAERAGLSVRGISDLERGVNRAPYQATTDRLIEALALSSDDAAALGAAASRRRRPASRGAALPVALTSFVGRERELAGMRELVREFRLVTITGVGGSGKTRLALELATDLQREWRGGTALIELASLADPTFIAQVIAQAIGLVGYARANTETVIANALKESEMILLVDNCEHLIDGCASLVQRLLTACPDLRVLATSREPLGIPGECTFSLPPLATPSLDRLPALPDLGRFEAVSLFVDRAAAAQPGFVLDGANAPVVARICSHLDGLPLAIELAAARVRSLSLEDISQRLDHRFSLLSRGARTAAPRHQTLRATIDWSHDLLTKEERILFRRLAIFAGGWTLTDAESVCTDDLLPRAVILDAHARIADKSLIVAVPRAAGVGRYRFLETVREYAADRLAEEEEMDRLRRRHFVHFLNLAERYYDRRMAGGSDSELIDLAAHRDNFRAALAWGAEVDPEGTLRLASALDEFWRMVSPAEGWGWLQRTLETVPEANPHRLWALLTAGPLAAQVAAYAEGTDLVQQAVAMARQADDRVTEAWARLWLGRLAVLREDLTGAEEQLQSALTLHGELGSPLGTLRSLALLGGLQAILKRRTEGEAKLQAAIDLAEEIEDSWGAGLAHMLFSISTADAVDAERTWLHALAVLHTPALGSLRGVSLQQLGRVSTEENPARALRLLGSAAGDKERTGTMFPAFVEQRAEVARQRATQLLDPQTAAQEYEEGRGMSMDEAIAFVDAHAVGVAGGSNDDSE